ncbi:glutathione peroxidase 1-like [Camelus ferus]|uniref:Glutathione peroxidase 1-like n=1 Tax=Camelus ferus TaxID=419612 RepID=A0A8B8SYY0_CAMFR|nr:glutathione peroxidase 1-like [Camelus dromedarius]XP_032335054.1 glutathione peroxidase 1-like [Camelus ferus]
MIRVLKQALQNELQRRLGLGPVHARLLVQPVCASGERQEQGDPEGLQVRPTDGRFVPNFKLFEKCDVNGTKAHPLFTFLREALLTPSDVATTLMTEPKFVSWYPQGRRLELREVPGRPGRRAHAQVGLSEYFQKKLVGGDFYLHFLW